MKYRLLFILILGPLFSKSQFEEPRVISVIGGMNGRIQKPFFLQGSRVGLWQSGRNIGPMAVFGYSQYVADTSEIKPRNTISFESGCFIHLNAWLLTTLTFGYDANGWYIRPAISWQIGEKFMVEVYRDRKLFGVGFMVDFKKY